MSPDTEVSTLEAPNVEQNDTGRTAATVGSLTSPKPPLTSPVSTRQPVHIRPISRSRTLPRKLRTELSIEVDADSLLRMQRWILGLAIVDFDLDIGPAIHGVFPSSALSQPESQNIAFSSFPDSVQYDQGSQVHSFRICERDSSENPMKPCNSTDGFIYCHSYFSQRRDTTSKRGYQQRSLVILTYHQYPALFSAISSILGPLYQKHGIPMLESACHNISNWPEPTSGATFQLGFLGSILPVELPHTADTQQLTETSSFGEVYDPQIHILASMAPLIPPPLMLFEASLTHLWSIWECFLLCEPILVFGSSAAMTSQAIWWFRDLLRPIPLANDFRPYFTIHDKDYSSIVNKLPPKTGIMLGVTNPIFERLCKHWPHILTLGHLQTHDSKFGATLAGLVPGWKTKTHKRFTSKDRSLLKQLEDACKGGERARMEASLVLRRHFCSRTIAFLVPLNRYLNTLIPPPAELSSPSTLRLKSFTPSNFFTSLKAHGTPLPFRSAGTQKEFYKRWLKTPAFGVWLAHQEEVVQGVLKENAARKSK